MARQNRWYNRGEAVNSNALFIMPDYSAILSRSWEITKKYKWLLVYGLILAGSGGFGGNNLARIGSSFGDSNEKDALNNASDVLGATTSSLGHWAGTVDSSTWILLIASLLLFIIFAITIQIITVSWAKASLIGGVKDADEGKEVTLASTAPKGLSRVKDLVIYNILSGFVIFSIVALWFVILIFSFAMIWGPNLGEPTVGVLAIILSTPLFIGSLIILGMINVYAERLVVLKNHTPWLAFKKGFSLARGAFIPTLVMGIINIVLASTIGCITAIVALIALGFPALIFVLPAFEKGTFPGVGGIGLIGIALLIFVYVNFFVRAALSVFTYSNWNIFFKKIVDKYEQK